MKHEAMMVVRSGMMQRIDSIEAHRNQLTLASLCEEIDTIRHDARIHGMDAVERMASMLESAMAMGGMGPVILSYLDLIREALCCEDDSPEASSTYLAMLSLRLGH